MRNIVEVIGIKAENCSNCHQCIAVCPVKICSDGSQEVVKFNNNLCIGCGRCIEACIKSHGGVVEKSARFAIDDAPCFVSDLPNKNIIALIAPSAQGNFDLPKLITALKTLGVKQVYDVSLGAEITIKSYYETISQQQAKTPVIAQPCPAIVKYIELHHPALLEYLAPVGSPVHNLAVYVKSLHPEADLAFISPCLAKRREFQDSGLIKYNVTYQSMLHILQEKNIDLASLPDSPFDNVIPAGIATKFSTPGGLKEAYLYHYPETPPSSIAKVNGWAVYEGYLTELEESIGNNDPDLPMIVDILSCDNGCNMGPGCVNKSLSKVEYSVSRRAEIETSNEADNKILKEFLNRIGHELDFSYHNYHDRSDQNQLKIPSEKELYQIYIQMHKLEEKDFRNCAACGYNSCYHMALAIYNGLNKIENCHLYQEKELRIEQQALRNMHNELSNVFDTMSDGVIVLNQEGRVSQFNPAALNITGFSGQGLLGIHVVDLFSGKAPYTLKLLETGQAFYDKEILIDGKYGQIHGTATGKPIFDESNQVVGVTIILKPMKQVHQMVNTLTGAQASFTFDSIIGEDEKLLNSVKLGMMAGSNDANVLLQAESGTGKEVFAQAIHNYSRRRNGPFVALNCAALPRELISSELFGYAEGAFTGARRGGRPGKFEFANGGTLLLDEIGDMPLEQQATLLRAIQEKAILRVGSNTLIKVDVRIIAATNQDLLALVEQGRFRADLYYRLNVINIFIPPLRERRKDIKLLFHHFLNEMAPKLDKNVKQIDPSLIKCLEHYDWPGNVRELQNVVERILLLAENGHLSVEHLPIEIARAAVGYTSIARENHVDAMSGAPLLGSRNERKLYALEQEKERIMTALNMHGGNVSRAAKELNISRNTLYRK
jgi:PAS domain S-box-containing protein